MKVSCESYCSCIAKTVSSDTTETIWYGNRTPTYVSQVCHCTNHKMHTAWHTIVLNDDVESNTRDN